MTITRSWIKLLGGLNRADSEKIRELQKLCEKADGISLKLELDYKLADAENGGVSSRNINEFMYFDGDTLIGYMGICDFGGAGSQAEITGMVHPEYRRKGVFSKLYELTVAECRRRKQSAGILALCDRNSISGKEFLRLIGAEYDFSEFEMYLRHDRELQINGITLRKANNGDARELARQDAIYFGHENADCGELRLPEEEEKRGFTMYLAVNNSGETVGKVNLQISGVLGGIYGLGVLPEYRGKGFGRGVLCSAVQILKNSGCGEIMLQVAAKNATALNLYKSCGFEENSVMDYYKVE